MLNFMFIRRLSRKVENYTYIDKNVDFDTVLPLRCIAQTSSKSLSAFGCAASVRLILMVAVISTVGIGICRLRCQRYLLLFCSRMTRTHNIGRYFLKKMQSLPSPGRGVTRSPQRIPKRVWRRYVLASASIFPKYGVVQKVLAIFDIFKSCVFCVSKGYTHMLVTLVHIPLYKHRDFNARFAYIS